MYPAEKKVGGGDEIIPFVDIARVLQLYDLLYLFLDLNFE